MKIEMIGIDHSNAEIDIRTIFAFTKKDTAKALAFFKEQKGIQGCVLLSTCNRMELWISTDDNYDSDLYELLCEQRMVNADLYRNYFTVRKEYDAVWHLFRLAGGLESRILGEDQIITQVGEALRLSRENYATDHVLETLFRQAVTAAKKVKTTGHLVASDQSVVHIAIQTLKSEGYQFEGKKCLVIGNGVMGKLAATQIQKCGADVTVTVRQYRSGIVEIPDNCNRIDYGSRMEIFPECDFVVSATVSPNYTMTKELVEQYRKKPVVFVDLAVPRDIDSNIRELDDVKLYDIDSFREEAHSEEQKKAIAEAEECFKEQIAEFMDWYRCVDLIPLIDELKEKIAEDLSPRLKKNLRGLSIDEEERLQLRADIEAAAQRTMNKMLFRMRDEMSQKAFRECLDCLKKIYE